ncbi:conserved hypothetical protein [Stutzerimonas stutzeri A1501]|uniref:Uncharacterized protein n=1 Tax=Stutzerimonas stutzeri (strain A1501) TaxID=379731 RepID=A4VRZ8_STUS1|nr:conserved hypothetical protein [Stutzerimonas stutzeri A1501]
MRRGVRAGGTPFSFGFSPFHQRHAALNEIFCFMIIGESPEGLVSP